MHTLISAYEQLLAELAGDLGACSAVLALAPRGSKNPLTIATYNQEAATRHACVWFEQRIYESTTDVADIRLAFRPDVALPGPDNSRVEQARLELLVLLRLAGWKDVVSPVLRACQRILAVNEEEMQQLILNVHDGPVQKLFAASFQVELLRKRAAGAAQDPALLESDLARVGELLAAALDEIKNTIGTMRPPEFRRRSVVDVLEGLLIQHEALTGMDVNFEVKGRIPPVGLAIKIAIYRILQEALSNAYRHAKVTSLDVILLGQDGWLTLEVVDRGPGFTPPQLEGPAGTEREEHIGLRGMRDRALLVGGQIWLSSKPGEGTRVKVTVPTDV